MQAMLSLRRLMALAGLVIALVAGPGAAAADAARHVTDLVYATVNGKPLSLDLHLPAGVRHPALLVFVHGGAWTTGSGKSPVPNVPAGARICRGQSGLPLIE